MVSGFTFSLYIFKKIPFKPWKEVLVSFIILVAQFGAGLRSCKSNCMKSKTRAWGKTPAEHQRHSVLFMDPILRGATLQTPLDAHACVFVFPTPEPCLVSSPLSLCLMMVTLIWARNLKSKWSFVEYLSHIRKFWNPKQNRKHYNKDFSFWPIKVVKKNSVPIQSCLSLELLSCPSNRLQKEYTKLCPWTEEKCKRINKNTIK